jgi:hypothetical protein
MIAMVARQCNHRQEYEGHDIEELFFAKEHGIPPI